MLPKPENAVVVKSASFDIEVYVDRTLDFREYMVRFPSLSYWQLEAIPVERRRQMFAEAVAAKRDREKNRMPSNDVEGVFSDLEFDHVTGEVLR